MSPAKNKEDSSKKNQSLSHSKGVVIPIDNAPANILTTAIDLNFLIILGSFAFLMH